MSQSFASGHDHLNVTGWPSMIWDSAVKTLATFPDGHSVMVAVNFPCEGDLKFKSPVVTVISLRVTEVSIAR